MVQLALEIVKETDENLHGLDNKTNEKLLSPIENKQQQQPPTETKEMEKRKRERRNSFKESTSESLTMDVSALLRSSNQNVGIITRHSVIAA